MKNLDEKLDSEFDSNRAFHSYSDCGHSYKEYIENILELSIPFPKDIRDFYVSHQIDIIGSFCGECGKRLKDKDRENMKEYAESHKKRYLKSYLKSIKQKK